MFQWDLHTTESWQYSKPCRYQASEWCHLSDVLPGISDPRCGTDSQLVEYSIQSSWIFTTTQLLGKMWIKKGKKFIWMGAKAPYSGSEPWHCILDPSKGVPETESRTGTRLVSPGRRPEKKNFDLSIYRSRNTNLKAIITTWLSKMLYMAIESE